MKKFKNKKTGDIWYAEDKEHIKAVRSAYEKIFRTQSGRKLCKEIFALS